MKWSVLGVLDVSDSFFHHFCADMIFFSAGFDALALDTINGGLVGVYEEDYEWVTSRVVAIANKHCNGRIVSVLEGGYAIKGMAVSPFARAVASHVKALNTPGLSLSLSLSLWRYFVGLLT